MNVVGTFFVTVIVGCSLFSLWYLILQIEKLKCYGNYLIESPFSLWYFRLQMRFLKCYETSLIFLKSQLQYSTEIEKRKKNRL